jgi:hypothetical protein
MVSNAYAIATPAPKYAAVCPASKDNVLLTGRPEPAATTSNANRIGLIASTSNKGVSEITSSVMMSA